MLRWLKKLLARLATIILGILLGILLLELGLHLIPAKMWKGLVSKSPARYALFQTDKNIGWVHTPNAEADWEGYGEFKVKVKINSLGLRDYERTYQKPAGTFRILLLGDSLTEGAQVDLKHTFPVELQTCLDERASQPIEVVNGGVTAYGPGEQLLFFAHEGVKYQPNLVLVAVYLPNDIKDMHRKIDSNMIKAFGGYYFYFADGRLHKRWIEWAEPPGEIPLLERLLRRYSALYFIFQSPESQVLREIDKIIELRSPVSSSPQPELQTSESSGLPSYADDGAIIIFAKNFPDNPLVSPAVKNLWRLLKATFQELQAEVTSHQAKLSVVLIPGAFQIHQEIYNQEVAKLNHQYDDLLENGLGFWDIDAPNKAMRQFMAEQAIPTLDLLPGFQAYAQAHADLLYFREDTHFNEKGHQLAAQLMCNWLVDQKLVPLQ
ncbi:MAG: hypothetical protein HYR94_17195 [Chloroflexi bacterium]|nr:hypothetical protein [Chloroflexota bacterium]